MTRVHGHYMVERYAYIDALRGLAILGVIMIHSSMGAGPLPSWLRTLIDEGQRGVQLFFVVSAVALMLSWKSRECSEEHLLQNFFIRRVFRIAPMFYIGIVVYLWLYGFGPRRWSPDGLTWAHVFATAAFVHGWHPASINSVVPGGWTIADEMMFYLVFPLIAIFVKRLSIVLVLLILSILLNSFQETWTLAMLRYLFPQEPRYLLQDFMVLWFPSQLPVFLLGVVSYFLISRKSRDDPDPKSVGSFKRTMFHLSTVAIILTIIVLPFLHVPLKHVVYGASFAVLAILLSQAPTIILVNPVTCFIGKVSYSAYVWHFAVLESLDPEISKIFGPPGNAERDAVFFVLFFLIVLLVTVLLAAVTYFLVEKPLIKQGNRMATWNERRGQ